MPREAPTTSATSFVEVGILLAFVLRSSFTVWSEGVENDRTEYSTSSVLGKRYQKLHRTQYSLRQLYAENLGYAHGFDKLWCGCGGDY